MKTIPFNIQCPNCHGAMVPIRLRCEPCELEVSGSFAGNEFASLPPEDLHFLRIFVHCEGSIRDMESALGVSYPTIKARLAKLKETLGSPPQVAESAASAPLPPVDESDPAAQAIDDLTAGKISYEEAMQRIRGTIATDQGEAKP